MKHFDDCERIVKFAEVLEKYQRIALVGGPKTGKTTLSSVVKDRLVIHGDDYMTMQWSEQSKHIVSITKGNESFVVEGVQVPRALRKGLEVDVVVHCKYPLVTLTDGQTTMLKAVETIIADWQSNNPTVPVVFLE